MTLRGRITRLEARAPVAERAARDAAALEAKLGSLLQRVQARADYADRADASPAERYCLALLRGEADTAAGIVTRALSAQR